RLVLLRPCQGWRYPARGSPGRRPQAVRYQCRGVDTRFPALRGDARPFWRDRSDVARWGGDRPALHRIGDTDVRWQSRCGARGGPRRAAICRPGPEFVGIVGGLRLRRCGRYTAALGPVFRRACAERRAGRITANYLPLDSGNVTHVVVLSMPSTARMCLLMTAGTSVRLATSTTATMSYGPITW